MYSGSYESDYNLADKSFEIGFKKHMLFIKQYELFQKKIPINGGVDVKFSLFYVAWESWQTAHYLFTVLDVLKVMMKRGVVFNSDHLENSLITSQNVMDLSIGILFFQESPRILHPPSCMDRPWI